MLTVHKSFPLYKHLVITEQMKVQTAECPKNFLWVCWWHFPSLPWLWISMLIWNWVLCRTGSALGFWSPLFVVLFFTCSDLLFTFAFDISIHNTYEIKFKVLIPTSSTLISFCISVKTTTLLYRRFLPCSLPPPRRKDKGQKWQFCLSSLSNKKKESSYSGL